MPDKPKPKQRQAKGTARIKAPELSPSSPNAENPLFSFRHVISQFSVAACTPRIQAALAERLEKWGGMTWLDIMMARREGLGHEKIYQASIRQPIPSHISPEEVIIAFRISQEARLIGVRDNQILHIIWVDPEHKVYAG